MSCERRRARMAERHLLLRSLVTRWANRWSSPHRSLRPSMLPVSNLFAASALDAPFQSESAAPGGTRSLRIKRRPARAPARRAARGIAGCGRLEGPGERIVETASSETNCTSDSGQTPQKIGIASSQRQARNSVSEMRFPGPRETGDNASALSHAVEAAAGNPSRESASRIRQRGHRSSRRMMASSDKPDEYRTPCLEPRRQALATRVAQTPARLRIIVRWSANAGGGRRRPTAQAERGIRSEPTVRFLADNLAASVTASGRPSSELSALRSERGSG